jgi:hypothetical protein
VAGPGSVPALRQTPGMVQLPAGFARPFAGHVVWLTREQGGRASGPPRPDYAHTAFVPPATVTTGSASFVLTGFSAEAWRSPAVGAWLVVENAGAHEVRPGSLVVLTEGPRTVGYFHVETVTGPR